MILTRRICLKPNRTQEKLLWKSSGTSRFFYNWTLAKQQENYAKSKDNKFIQDGILRKEIKRLKNKLKRYQRKVSNKYEKNKEGLKYVKTKNIVKLEKEIKLIHRDITNLRTNYIHQVTSDILKTKVCKINVEDLNIRGVMKNKHLSKAIQEQSLNKFISTLEYKCKLNNVHFQKIDRYFPSSKTCSSCGNIKKDLKLSNRIYKCDVCGFKIDRDLNASYNIRDYIDVSTDSLIGNLNLGTDKLNQSSFLRNYKMGQGEIGMETIVSNNGSV